MSTSTPQPRHSSVPWLIFLLLLLGFEAMTALWLHLNKGPTHWDDSWYLLDSLSMFDSLAKNGIPGWFHFFFYEAQGRIKAPLMCALPTPIYLLFGRNADAAFIINLIFIAILLTSVYCIARRFWGNRVALIAVFITGSMPQLFGLTTWYLVEYGLAAFVVAAVWSLIKSEDLTRLRWVALFSLLCGLGVLQKIVFPVYVIPLLLYYVFRRLRRARFDLATLAALILPALIIGAPWYIINFQTAVDRAIFSGFSHQEADLYGTGPPFTWRALKFYAFKFINEGIGAPYFCVTILVVLLLLLIIIIPKTRARRAPSSSDGRWMIFLWGLPFLIFLFGHNKDIRFIAPLMPIFAILLALGFQRIILAFRLVSYPLAAILLFIPLGFLIQFCFEPLGTKIVDFCADPQNPRNTLVGLHFLQWDMAEVRMYEAYPWPLTQTLRDICAIQPPPPGQLLDIMIGSDSMHFNSNNLQLAARQARLPIIIHTTAYSADPAELRAEIRHMSFFLYRPGGEDSAYAFNKLFDAAWDEVNNSGRFEEIKSNIKFPDQGILSIFHNTDSAAVSSDSAFIPAKLAAIHPINIPFGNRILLNGFSATRAGQNLQLKYHWQCINPVERQYRLFVHLLDDKGTIIAVLDHDILNAKPPMTNWQLGDSQWESTSYMLNALKNVQNPTLEIGFFDPHSRRILPPVLPAAPDSAIALMPKNIGVHLALQPFMNSSSPSSLPAQP